MEGAETGHATLTLVLALGAGVLAQSLARHVRVPGIVLLLAVGASLGPDGLGWVHPEALGSGLFGVVDLAVAVILFEGGLNLEISRLRREQSAMRRLVTLGAGVTLAGGALAAHVALDWDWMPALLFGSLVVVTGPTVVGPLVRDLRLRTRVATLLEAEGVLIDPIGAILAVLVLELALLPGADAFASGARGLVYPLAFGGVAGIAVGFVVALLLRAPRVIPDGFGNIFTLASVLVLLGVCDEVVPHSGIVAVTLAGVVVGNLQTRVTRDLREFKDQLTVLLIGLLFVLLAADVRVADVRELGVPGLVVVGVLIAVVRPLGVVLCTLGSELSWRERALLAWLAPRGIVAAAVASLAASALEVAGIAGGTEIRALVFLTIAVTVVLAGLTARPVASLLGLRLPGRDTVAILGAEGLGRALAEGLREGGVGVVLLDSNPVHCREAEEAGLPVVFGNALEERTLARARLETVVRVVGLTANETLNGTFVRRSRELFGVPDGSVALSRLSTGVTPEIVREDAAEVLFEAAHDVERWNVRFRHGEVELRRLTFRGEKAEDEPPVAGPEQLVFLCVQRGKRCFPMYEACKPEEGDVASVAIHAPELDAALERLRALGWVEEMPEEAD